MILYTPSLLKTIDSYLRIFCNFYPSKQGVINNDFIRTFMYTSYSGKGYINLF